MSKSVSTITPVYKGAEFLPQLVQALDALRTEWEQQDQPYRLLEAIFVDDGATDQSPKILADLSKRHPWVKVISLTRNFGQHPATIAGILHSSADWVCTLDEDLQHNPQEIRSMLDHAESNSLDLVYAKPKKGSVSHSFLRDIFSKLAKSSVRRLSGNLHISSFSSFRLINGSVARSSAAVTSHSPYLDTTLCWFTEKIGTQYYEMKDSRFQGADSSGYNFQKLVAHYLRLVLSSHIKLLRLFAFFGAAVAVATLFLGSAIVATKLVAPDIIDVDGWTSLLLAILFFGGAIMFMCGLMMEYISILLLHTQGKPPYSIAERRPSET